MSTKYKRIAIVNTDKCKPDKCKHECRRKCPVVKNGQMCITIGKDTSDKKQKATISEILCIGCGICTNQCPFGAIDIINLPTELSVNILHRYGPNSFQLHGLPMPKQGEILGLIGANGCGKSTALKILSGQLMANLGKFVGSNSDPPDWQEVLNYFKGSETFNYMKQIQKNQESVSKIKSRDNSSRSSSNNRNSDVAIKPQYVDLLARKMKDTVGTYISDTELLDKMDLARLNDRKVDQLSGGELQRFAIALVMQTGKKIMMFDEPSSYLDIKQRISMAAVIRKLKNNNRYVLVVEHDLSIVDYISDYICCFYGEPNAYGIVSGVYSNMNGINVFLDGYSPSENIRFRKTPISFRRLIEEDDNEHRISHKYPSLSKQYYESDSDSDSDSDNTMKKPIFRLEVEEGNYNDSEIVMLLGENGTGKSTFIKMLAGYLKADNLDCELDKSQFSYKPQILMPKFTGTVRELFQLKIGSALTHPQFTTDIIKPFHLDKLMDEYVRTLSGGEIQRVAIALCLGKPAKLYLLDEPSAYLDSEQRIVVSHAIRRFIINSGKPAFIVEHDFMMANYMADKVIVFSGEPGQYAHVGPPMNVVDGLNKFLSTIDVTFRQDINYRPRINKLDSQKDNEQKANGKYYIAE